MKLDLKAKIKDLLSMRFSKLVIGVVVVAIVAGVGLTNKTIQEKLFGKKAAIVQNLSTVKKGNLQVLVSGSGPIYFNNASKLYSKINATVTAANYKAGDKVKKGAIIYEFDTTDAQSAIADNQNAVAKSQLSAAASVDAVNQLAVVAPISGTVTSVAVSNGDAVQKGGTILTITDTSKLKVSLPYNSADIGKIAVGQTADVNIASLMQSVNGTVTSVGGQSTATNSGSKLYTVDIQINNPGALNEGMIVNADIQTSKGAVSSTSTALLAYTNKQTVISQSAGTVQGISAKLNQKISSGSTITTLKSDDLTRAVQSANLDTAGSESKLATTVKQLDNYKIIAPYDGVITVMTNKVGDTVKPGDEVADVSDPTQMEFDVPVDELDVAKLAVGQKTNISVDALPATTATPVIGEVEKIAVTGTAVSGVTTFPITIKIDGNLGVLKGGMNANAEIMVSDRQDILYVPIEAITKVGTKSYVWLKGTGNGTGGGGFQGGSFQGGGNAAATGTTGTTGTSSSSSGTEAKVSTNIQSSNTNGGSGTRTRSASGSAASKTQSYYYGAVRTEVQVGANNDTYLEITGGLNEGDKVVLPQTKAASTTAKTTSTGGMGGGGGAAGGGARSGGGF